ncbi:efflux RND transporter periplasmic adaptor subunit [Spirosoma rigui]|uniref:efflux RND transporter periplasmic adaptor subunit n=1 Tax=Spirosoma rigui TaxID=564064 RepID=UPI0009B03F98|nr:efflux RND transporter periplasmic adaptor subunit [Spirosoma rigui]
MKSLHAFVATIAVGSLLVSGCQKQEHSVPTSAADSTSSYLIDTVRRLPPQQKLVLNGAVTFDQEDVIRVFPLVSGNVETINAPLGTYVKKGQALAVIRSGDISTYVNDYQADKSDLEVALQNEKNVSAQYKAGFASETDYLTARNAVKKAEEELSKSTNILQVYGGSSNSGNPYFTVKAPIAGYVVQRDVNAGQDLRSDSQNPLFTISSLKQVWVMANVYEQDIPLIRQGQAVTVNVLAYPDKVFTGTIGNVSSVLDEQARVLKVRIVLANPEGLLKPDMFATVHAQLADRPNAADQLAVPQKALVFDRDQYYVVVQTAPNKYAIREVSVSQNTTRYAFVTGGGLQPGDRVVTEGSLLIYSDLTN